MWMMQDQSETHSKLTSAMQRPRSNFFIDKEWWIRGKRKEWATDALLCFEGRNRKKGIMKTPVNTHIYAPLWV